MKRHVEITLWPEMRHLIVDDVIPGHIVAITSTMVTEHNGRLQLESTYLTTVTINPDVPQTIEHVNRLRSLPAMQPTEAVDKTVTIFDLKVGSQQNTQAYEMCNAGAVIHSHGMESCLATMINPSSKEFRITMAVDETVALESPVLDMNTEVFSVCDSAPNSGDRMEGDYCHNEVVLDSDDMQEMVKIWLFI
ncbi:hypothetical protein CASFOL_012171 [Castilleja foliolosa]|uniref:Uncharacterized protein n=2 Tax=Castilleja foliolosa TaxID=1961234 RepID=A0ABD3DTA9_9LAMI